MSRNLRIALALGAAVVLVALATTIALANGGELLDGKLRTGDTVVIGANETVDGDVYLAGGTVTVDGSIDGDLTAIGGQVTVRGTVTGDVLAAGGTVSITGTVEGDIRTSGGQVTLGGPVGEDVLVAGGQATLQNGATVDGDFIVTGGQVTVAGAVAGSIEANAGTYSRSGTVGGTEHVALQDRDDEDEADTTTNAVFDAMRYFVVLVLLGALMVLVVPRLLDRAESNLRQRPAASLGWGFLTVVGYVVLLIAAFLLIILLAIAFGLLQLALLVLLDVFGGLLAVLVVTFVFVVASALVADLVVGLGLARLVMRGAAPSRWVQLGLLVAGAAVVVIVTSLPIIGGVAKLLVMLFGLGALALIALDAWRGRSRTQETPPAPAL